MKPLYKVAKRRGDYVNVFDFSDMVGMLLLFWVVPIYVLINAIYHFFKGDTILVSKEDYYKDKIKQLKREEKESKK